MSHQIELGAPGFRDFTHCYRCLTRFKNAVVIYPRLAPLVRHLGDWVTTWIDGVSATPPVFDPFKNASSAARDHIIAHLRGKIDRLVSIVDRELTKFNRSLQEGQPAINFSVNTGSNEGIVAALQTTYDGPGEDRRRDGPHVMTMIISTSTKFASLPTHEELISRIPPFLPANHNSTMPHTRIPADSMEKIARHPVPSS